MSRPINSILGNSGAELEVVHYFDGSVVKHAPLIDKQGYYMTYLGRHVCPEVHMIIPDAYYMELMDEYIWKPSVAETCGEILIFLKDRVWPRPAAISESFNEGIFKGWLEKVGCRAWISTYDLLCDTKGIPMECLTHGDPTVANMMQTKNGELRLIDPIAPRGRVPSWRCVDEGKVLQSWLGWECLLFDVSVETLFPAGLGRPYLLLNQAMQDPWVWYWAAIHLTRTIPYLNDEVKVRKVQTMAEKASNKCLQYL